MAKLFETAIFILWFAGQGNNTALATGTGELLKHGRMDMTKFRLKLKKRENIEWLNQMAKDGHAFVNYMAGFYTFEECTPGEYEYRIEHSDDFFSVSDKYKEFAKNNNIEIIQCWGTQVFLRRKASDVPFPQYPDTDALLEFFLKIRSTFKLASIVAMLCIVLELYSAMSGFAGGFLLTLFIGIILLVSMQAIINANNIVLELRKRKKEFPKEFEENIGKISRLLILGLVLSAVPFAIESFGGSELYAGALQLISFFLLLIGIFKNHRIWGR